jgi:hypothetical protein
MMRKTERDAYCEVALIRYQFLHGRAEAFTPWGLNVLQQVAAEQYWAAIRSQLIQKSWISQVPCQIDPLFRFEINMQDPESGLTQWLKKLAFNVRLHHGSKAERTTPDIQDSADCFWR